MKNTKVSYIYRDGSNYKMPGDVIIHGTLTDEQIQFILSVCDDNTFFPDQVGLPRLMFSDHDELTEDDHPWNEFIGGKYSFEPTDVDADIDLTADELVANFKAAEENGWDEEASMEDVVLKKGEHEYETK